MKILLTFLLFCACPHAGFSQTMSDSCSYSIPKSLTPNCETGSCELLTITSTCTFSNFSLTVFNRWGNTIFESDRPEKKFDSTPFPEGTYFWKLKATFSNSQKVDDQGFLNIYK